MKLIKQKLELAIYGYDPALYMPVRRDGQLENKAEFIAYKLNQLAKRLPINI